MSTKGKRILVVDDDPDNIKLLSEYLAHEGHTVASASDGNDALHRLRAWKPQLVFLDVNMPGISGLELIPKLRMASPEEYVSIVLVSGAMAVDDVMKGLDAGADDYLTKPFRAQELLSRIRVALHIKEAHDSLRRASHRGDELASLDELTGLLGIRAFFRKADDEILRARRFRKPISLMLLNLDGFFSVNEANGFAFGSELLREAALRIKSCVRAIDHVGRVGADEFIVMLVDTDLSGAEFMAERIREAISAKEFRHDQRSAKVTACIGVAGIQYDHAKEETTADLYRNASEALRAAKHNGPSSVEIFSMA